MSSRLWGDIETEDLYNVFLIKGRLSAVSFSEYIQYCIEQTEFRGCNCVMSLMFPHLSIQFDLGTNVVCRLNAMGVLAPI